VTERRLVVWALGVLMLGVVLLVWAAFTETPVASISELKQEGAFQHFRIRGKVTKSPYLLKTPYSDSNIFSFKLMDDSVGEKEALKVKVDGPVYDDLVEAGKVPARGDLVDVEGTLYAGKGFRVLSLNTAAMLRIVEKGGE